MMVLGCSSRLVAHFGENYALAAFPNVPGESNANGTVERQNSLDMNGVK